jgi:hypothetical protein
LASFFEESLGNNISQYRNMSLVAGSQLKTYSNNGYFITTGCRGNKKSCVPIS